MGNIKKYIEREDSRSLVFYLSLYTLVLMDNLTKVGAIHQSSSLFYPELLLLELLYIAWTLLVSTLQNDFCNYMLYQNLYRVIIRLMRVHEPYLVDYCSLCTMVILK